MRYCKKKGYEGSIRKVVSDDKTIVFGVVGIVKDLLNEGILEDCDAPSVMWCFVDKDGYCYFGWDRQDVVDYAIEYHLPGCKIIKKG